MPTLSKVSRLTLKNILVPTDFSPASQAALPFAQALAQTYGSTMLVAHTIPPESHRQIGSYHVPVEDDVVRLNARLKMDVFLREPGFAGIPVKTLLDRGGVTGRLNIDRAGTERRIVTILDDVVLGMFRAFPRRRELHGRRRGRGRT